jgi:hypothetical protein
MSAEAVALCMGISDSRHTLLISTSDLQIRNQGHQHITQITQMDDRE